MPTPLSVTADQHVLAGLDAGVLPAIFVVEIGVAGFDGQLAAVRHGVARVEREIEQRASSSDTSASTFHSPAPLIVSSSMRLAERARQQIGHADDQPVGVDRARIERLPAREREQPLGQLRGPLGADQRVVERAFGARLDHAALGDAEIADDDGQQVVEVVRDAAGQLADRLHLLRLPQRLLGEFAPLALGVELARTPHGQESPAPAE